MVLLAQGEDDVRCQGLVEVALGSRQECAWHRLHLRRRSRGCSQAQASPAFVACFACEGRDGDGRASLAKKVTPERHLSKPPCVSTKVMRRRSTDSWSGGASVHRSRQALHPRALVPGILPVVGKGNPSSSKIHQSRQRQKTCRNCGRLLLGQATCTQTPSERAPTSDPSVWMAENLMFSMDK